MLKGDIVLITFPFTDLAGSKLRPAVVLIENNRDVTVCFITSQLTTRERTDILLFPNHLNGLRKESFIRISKLATLDKSLVQGLLGRVSAADLLQIDENLKHLFQIK